MSTENAGTNLFMEALNQRSAYEEMQRSAINAVFARNGSRARFQLECKAKLFETLDNSPEFTVINEPGRFLRVGRSTVEHACYIPSIKDVPVKRIFLELDIDIGAAFLFTE